MTSEKSRISYDALIVQLPQRMIHKETWFRYIDIVARMRKRLPRIKKEITDQKAKPNSKFRHKQFSENHEES